jgi:hypothetical protein
MTRNESLFAKTDSCRFCGKERVHRSWLRRGLLYERKKFHYVKCKDCKSYFLIPELQESDLKKLYSTEYLKSEESVEQRSLFESKFADFREFLRIRNNSGKGILLDYGCGANSLPIAYAIEAGYKAIGMEYDYEIRRIAALNTGSEILSRDEIEELDESLDIIFLGDVLEHLNDPLAELKMLRSKLSAHGVVYIQGPLEGAGTILNNFIGLYSLLSPRKLSTFPPYHVNLFSNSGMLKLAEMAKFSTRKIRIDEVSWPAPTLSELKTNRNPRTMALFALKSLDKVLGRAIVNYGTRITMVLEKS